ncbi:MAG: hypothetical protein ACLQNG_06480 [Acidimicrobiales bacterium]
MPRVEVVVAPAPAVVAEDVLEPVVADEHAASARAVNASVRRRFVAGRLPRLVAGERTP